MEGEEEHGKMGIITLFHLTSNLLFIRGIFASLKRFGDVSGYED